MFWWFFVGFFFLLVNILDKPPPPPTLKNDATCLETWYLLYKYCDFFTSKICSLAHFFKNINFCKGQCCVRAAVQKNWSVNCISLYNAQLIDIVKWTSLFFWDKKRQVDINLMTAFHYRPPQGRASLIVPLAPIFGRELFS